MQSPAQIWSDLWFKGRLSPETTEMESKIQRPRGGRTQLRAASARSQKFIWTQLVFQDELQSVWLAH